MRSRDRCRAMKSCCDLCIHTAASVKYFFSIVVTILSNIRSEVRPRGHFPKLNSQCGARLKGQVPIPKQILVEESMRFKRIEVCLSLFGSLILLAVLSTRAPAATNSSLLSINTVADGGEPPPPPRPLPPSQVAETTPVFVADGGEPPPPPRPLPPSQVVETTPAFVADGGEPPPPPRPLPASSLSWLSV